MGVIKIFAATDTVFDESNGEKILQPTKCIVHKQDNGDYYADIECSIAYAEWMIQDNIVVIEGQGFRLNNPQINNNKMIFRALHVSYDAKNYVIQTIEVENYTVQAIAGLLDTLAYPDNNFTITSDIGTVLSSCKYIYQSLYDCIMALVETSGGHLVRDNWSISINASIAVDKEREIAMCKNIKVYQSKENWDDVVTTLIPVGSDGTVLDNSMLVNEMQYDIPYVRTVTFTPREGVDVTNSTDVKDDLNQQALAYLEEHQYPKVSYTVDASNIGDVEVGEVIQLRHKRIGKNLSTNVYAIEYNAITATIEKATFGTFCEDLKNTLKTNIADKFISMYRDIQKVDSNSKTRFQVNADGIAAEITRSTIEEGNLSTRIQANAEGITTKVGKNSVISEINQSAEEVKVNANKISLEGLFTANNKFKVHVDGSMECDEGLIRSSYFRDIYYITEGGETFPILSGSYVNSIHMMGNGQYLWFDGIMNIDWDHLMLGLNGSYQKPALMNHSHPEYLTSMPYHTHGSTQITAELTGTGNINLSGPDNAASVTYVQDNFERKSSSDFRLKRNIATLSGIEEFYMNLKPKSYEFKGDLDDGYVHFGLLAQELLNNAIEHGIDANGLVREYETRGYYDEGMYVRDKAYRIDYESLHAMTIYMIQRLFEEVNKLKGGNTDD